MNAKKQETRENLQVGWQAEVSPEINLAVNNSGNDSICK